MTPASVKFQLFKVTKAVKESQDVEAVLSAIAKDPLAGRARVVRGSKIRLERVEEVAADPKLSRRWELDFVRLRDVSGPGKGSDLTAVEDLDIKANEFFGEEAAALFFPEKGYLVVQYNHHGVRPAAMVQYLSQYMEQEANDFEIAAVLDADADAKFGRMKHVRRFSVAVDLDKLTDKQREAGVGLGEALNRASKMNGARISIQVSVGHDPNRTLHGVKTWLNKMLKTDALISAEVAGREAPDGEISPLDLIAEQLTNVIDINPGTGKRLPWDARLRALGDTAIRWKERMKN
ncbi:TPA: DUF6731 family protein [Stenotrophomonas maltophilia]|uniref:DUF6731 family protein n=1 Tax=Stenotrophomonas maltophilia TaxID=40324 RepID=UPI00111058FB|nr:DUF6731 family protein [Stenotrophomonas maltophilia]MDG9938394.1 hypothetical protein [Stenotrophomonas maltophilia]MDH0558761.1 hypothetical protein [Stenotrophomonas maltophilia]MDH1685183.1 hypothetical protein [Stenotrophomonas maltophilia]TIL19323.1 hypothetical protein E4420_10825 [Stenotrophomonas maltophilia]